MAPTTDPPVDAWKGGWYGLARPLPSPNFGRRPAAADVDLIVVHSISLPAGHYGGDEVQRLFTNQLDWNAHPSYAGLRGIKVSAHFYIRRDGELWQFVSCDDRAWHAGVSSWRGRQNCNDDSIGIELEGLEGHLFEPAQYEALADLCIALAQRHDIAYIAGHEHIAPGRKHDPGNGFDWQWLYDQLGWKRSMFPAALPLR